MKKMRRKRMRNKTRMILKLRKSTRRLSKGILQFMGNLKSPKRWVALLEESMDITIEANKSLYQI